MPQATARMADFDLSPEQRQVRQLVRNFAEKEILPFVERYEQEERYPLELIAKLPELGLMGPMIPEEYGGSFTDVVTYGVICEELARCDWVVASVVSVANSLLASSILAHGSRAQKERWLPPLAKGEMLASACLTEPGGGTDLGNLRTTAERVDGGWRLTGTKVFISHAAHAGSSSWWRRSIARRSTRASPHSCGPEERGVIASPSSRCARSSATTSPRCTSTDVFVPDDDVLGEPGGASRSSAPRSTWVATPWPRAASGRRSAASTWRPPTPWSARLSARRSASSR